MSKILQLCPVQREYHAVFYVPKDPDDPNREYKWNHFDVKTGDKYWISGPRKDGQDRLYPQSTQVVEVDEDVSEEYWAKIRGLPGGGKA